MTPPTKAIAAVIATCAVLLAATPAAAADGEILINQAKAKAGGITPGDAAGFPVTISRAGHYKLAGKLLVPASMNGIEIRANDVSIDLNGYTIRSDPRGAAIHGVFVATEASRIRIINGTISGFGASGNVAYGILSYGTRTVVENLRIVDNAFGVKLGKESRVRNSTIANNGSDGVACYQCLVEGTIVAGNGNVGILDTTTGGGAVLGNVIVGNTGYGIVSPNAPYPPTGYSNNILIGNNNGGLQGQGVSQLHPNACDPACP